MLAIWVVQKKGKRRGKKDIALSNKEETPACSPLRFLGIQPNFELDCKTIEDLTQLAISSNNLMVVPREISTLK